MDFPQGTSVQQIIENIMNKFLLLGIPFLALATAWAADTQETLSADMKFFKDASCTALAPGVANTNGFQSDSLKNLAQKILDKKYNPAYLSAEYEAYPTPQVIGKTLRLNDGFSKYENMTGVYLEKGQHVVIVGKTEGRTISLLLPNLTRKPAKGIEPTKDPNGWGLHKKTIPLKEGVNIVNVEIPTNAYISYFADDYATAPKIPVTFVTGKVNGFFDLTRGDTNQDWDKLLSNAVGPFMDARGKYIQVAYPVEFLKKFASSKGVELIQAYDKLIKIQYDLMGLTKYNKIPKNRVLARANYNYYMFRDGDGVAYLANDGTMRMVTNPQTVLQGDPCWGFSHEVGHVMQMRPITWGGMTEVSNNIFSLQAQAVLGLGSRLKDQNSYDKAREELIGKNKSYLQSGDVFVRLVPFWQLHLYFTQHGYPDFYPDVMEYLRNHAGQYHGNDTIKYQFEFIKACCAVTKTDLTDFFEKWGFFWTGQLSVGDYGHYDFNITQQMVDETKAWIAAQKFKKPATDITLVKE